MIRTSLWMAALALLFFLDGLSAAPPPQSPEGKLFYSLPTVVRRTLDEQTGDEGLASVVRTNTPDEPSVFLLQTTNKLGQVRALTVAADGKLLAKRMFTNELPVPVRKSIDAFVNGGDLVSVEQNIDDTFTETYVAQTSRNHTNREFTVDDQGELLEWQVFLGELSPAIQERIKTQAAGAALGEITKSYDDMDYDLVYDVEMTRNGTNRSFTVSTNGDLLEEQVFLGETPPAVQKAVKAEAKRGRVGTLQKSIEDGETYYNVEFISGRKTVVVAFDTEGAIAGEEEDMLWSDLPPLVKRALQRYRVLSEITDVNRTAEGSDTVYEIELRDSRLQKSYFDFKADGTLLSTNLVKKSN